MTDAIMKNLDAFKMCILGVEIEDDYLKDINLKRSEFKYEDGKIYPNVETALNISNSRKISDGKIERNGYRKGKVKLTDTQTKEVEIFKNKNQVIKKLKCSANTVKRALLEGKLVLEGRYKIEYIN